VIRRGRGLARVGRGNAGSRREIGVRESRAAAGSDHGVEEDDGRRERGGDTERKTDACNVNTPEALAEGIEQLETVGREYEMQSVESKAPDPDESADDLVLDDLAFV